MKGLLDGDATTARVPKRTKVRGQPHRLAYITDDEARVLRARGGGVTPSGGQMMHRGVPAFMEGQGGGDGSNPSDGMDSGGPSPGPSGQGENEGAVADPGKDGAPGYGGAKDDGISGGINDALGGYGFSGVSSPEGYGYDASNGGDPGTRAPGGGYYGAPPPASPPPAPPAPVFKPHFAAAPVYSAPPEMAAPLQGRVAPGFLASAQAFQTLTGYRPPAQAPAQPYWAPGGVPQQYGTQQAGAWQAPPPLVPMAQYPQPPILRGDGSGSPAYFSMLDRLQRGY